MVTKESHSTDRRHIWRWIASCIPMTIAVNSASWLLCIPAGLEKHLTTIALESWMTPPILDCSGLCSALASKLSLYDPSSIGDYFGRICWGLAAIQRTIAPSRVDTQNTSPKSWKWRSILGFKQRVKNLLSSDGRKSKEREVGKS